MVPKAGAGAFAMLMTSSALMSEMTAPVPIGLATTKRPVPVRDPGKVSDMALGDGVATVEGTVPVTDVDTISLS